MQALNNPPEADRWKPLARRVSRRVKINEIK